MTVALNGRAFDGPSIEVDAYCVRSCSLGLLCEVGKSPTAWIPYGVISEKSEVTGPGDRGTLIVSSIYAINRGWLR